MDIILKYFPYIYPIQKEKLVHLYDLYLYWNKRINLVSRKDVNNLYERHLLHSLAINKFIDLKPGTKLLDVGTGGGLPGIPLAIMNPAVSFKLIDSVGKKVNVVRDIIKELGLKNTKTEQIRVENVKNEKYDFIIGRAVTNFPAFAEHVAHLISKKELNDYPNGIIYLSGGDLSEVQKKFKHVKIISVNQYFDEQYFDSKKLIYLPV